jgi:DNA polymerase
VSPLLDGLEMLAESGVSLSPDGDCILWEAARDLTETEARWIVANKQDLLRELTVVRLDFETISPVDIKLGTPAYLRNPETLVLMLVWAVGLGAIQVWWPGDPLPVELVTAIAAGATVVSHGAFDRLVWAARMVPLGWPQVPDERWSDTMARCRAHRLPAKLKNAARRLELGVWKDPRGEKLIKRATEAAKGGKPLSPEELADFEHYARTDLDVLRKLDSALPDLSEQDQAAYRLTEKMNALGFPIDRTLVGILLGLWQAEGARLVAAMQELNDLRPTQAAKVKAYVEQRIGAKLPSGEGKVWATWLREHPDADPHVRAVMTVYIEALNKSGTKLKTLLDCTTDADPFARGALVWHGAHTGRWSATVFQPQNMPKQIFPPKNDPEHSTWHMLLGLLQPGGPAPYHRDISLKQRIAACLRAAIQAPDGQRLAAVDFSQVESRVLCWLAGQQNKLDAYRRGEDVYLLTVAKLDPGNRNLGKLLELACGFGGGVAMLMRKAPDYEIALTEQEAQRYIEEWRTANAAITDLWQALYRTVRQVVESPVGTRMAVGNAYPRNLIVASHERDDTLRIQLPSGRQLIYHQPRIVPDDEFEWRFNLSYQQAGPGDWVEKDRVWPGLLIENVVQAVAADLMTEKLLQMDAAGIVLVGAVHDEAIALAAEPQAQAVVDRMVEIMSTPPAWALDLPLAAEGYYNDRYLKPPKTQEDSQPWVKHAGSGWRVTISPISTG